MIALTSEQLSERRTELAAVEEQLRQLGRRRSHLRREILAGYALPERQTGSRQLPLPAVENKADLEVAADEAVKEGRREDVRRAILLALEGRAEATVEGLLNILATQFKLTSRLPATRDEVGKEIDQLLADGALVLGTKPGWYRRPGPPETKNASPKAKPGKVAKRPAAKSGKPLWKPGRPGFVPTLTPAGTRRVIELIAAAPGQRMLADEVCAALDLPKDCHHPNGCYGGTWWGLSSRPAKSAKPAAKKATKARPSTAPTPTKPVSEAKAKILARVPLEAWEEGLHSVVGLISKNDTTRGAWLLLHARPSATVAAEVLDLLVVAGLVEAGDFIRLGAPIKADLEAQPGARLSYLLTRRLGAWVCQQIASYRKPPTADVLAKTGVPRGLWCVLTNALEEEGRLCRSKGGGVPVWAVTAQGRTDPLFEGIEPAPAREEAAE